MKQTITDLAKRTGGETRGDGAIIIERVAELRDAGAGEIAFVADEKLLDAARVSRAAGLIVTPQLADKLSGDEISVTDYQAGEARALIIVKNPKLAFALVAEVLHPRARQANDIHPTAIIDESARVGADVFIGAHVVIEASADIGDGAQIYAGCYIGANASVGAETFLYPRCVLYDGVTVGARCVLHAGVIIGADGYGYVPDENNIRHQFPQIGTVIIEDDVELGAQTCVDRGALGATRIGAHTKIDNLVQIGHNVEIGARVVIAAQTGISGSCVIEDDAIIGGQVGFGDHARVQSGAIIGSKAGILPGKIVRAGVWWGVPVVPLAEYKIRNAHVARLPNLRAEVKELKREVERLRAEAEKKS